MTRDLLVYLAVAALAMAASYSATVLAYRPESVWETVRTGVIAYDITAGVLVAVCITDMRREGGHGMKDYLILTLAVLAIALVSFGLAAAGTDRFGLFPVVRASLLAAGAVPLLVGVLEIWDRIRRW